MDGVIVVDKSEGWTSHDVVAKLRRIAATKKVGHLGTLDPMATGVLPLVVGRATRLATFYTRNDKIYEGVVRFGWSTDTYDREGAATSEKRDVTLNIAELEPLLQQFRGEILQTPPPVSAKKVAGKRAYELARQGIAVELQPVRVSVYELAILAVSGDQVRLRTHCSAGTYVRSIAHDLGQALGCGAHLDQLRRISSGEFDLSQARTIPQLESLAADDRLIDALVPAASLLPAFPAVFVDELAAAHIRNGRNFPASPFTSQPAARYVKALNRKGELIAIGEAVLPHVYHPAVVF